ncbi:two-component system CitB family response regulator [Amycolatopsis bartoniae]|uniref:Transcriptional regulatory protein n=1 Tax=Amycolatopsis bartoniae TaxID=941986 RepID=A0A8H9IXZ0_9PSEU|nr:response regulator [Amycolatopsis bartoniae]MBB2934740.1 two-component system CitB family response regulator [Amycolatopsis bartoniae]TVT01195.1 response regulator [Amycolatopsis bartoniae]GHF45114.1 transcriptional regulatory protein [Amycolatopsis bartoniae]
MIRTLIVDDDFRVAGVHAGFVAEVPGFAVAGTAHTAAEARARARELAPDLVLLDVYLPDESGLSLLAELQTDTIVLSAATDTRSVLAAIRAGALNYLIKPFTTRQLAERLTAYARYRQLVGEERNLGQEDVDRAFRLLHEQDRAGTGRAQSSATARLVSEQLRQAARPLSAAEIASRLGVARATAQRYLTALAEAGTVEMRLRYGATGRPEHEYSWRA